MQERAIDVALNTPDIAVIQGPPGTGKTTVIAAILERLNEIATKEGVRGQGQVLLSGFQHDAVENMIDRISLNGIPVPKFGERSDPSAGRLDAFEKNLEEWCGRIAQELREKNPQIADLEEESAIKDLYKQYLRTPTHKLATTLVTRIAEIDVTILGEKLSRQAATSRSASLTQAVASEDQGRHLAAAQRIRTRAESFADDGPERAEDALVDLEDVLDERPVGPARPSQRLERRSRCPAVPWRTRTTEARAARPTHCAASVQDREAQRRGSRTSPRRPSREVQSHGFTATDKKSAALGRVPCRAGEQPVWHGRCRLRVQLRVLGHRPAERRTRRCRGARASAD